MSEREREKREREREREDLLARSMASLVKSKEG